MSKRIADLMLFLSKLFLVVIVLAIFFIGLWMFYSETLFFFWGNRLFVLLLLYASVLYLMSRIYNGFSFGSVTLQEIILSWILCLVVANVFQYLILCLLELALLPVGGILIILLAQIICAIPMSIGINKLYYRQNPAQNVVLVFGNREKLHEYQTIISMQRMKFRISRAISGSEPIGTILDVLDEAESVFFLDVDEKTQNGLLEYCYLHNKRTYVLPTFSNILVNTARTMWLTNTPVFALKRPEPDLGVQFVKRAIDITIASIGIILSSLLMLVVWIAVRLYDKHPAIYKQTRVTKGGKCFTLYKFRSMHPDAEDDGVPRLTSKDDDRITPVGRIIRRTRIDELPQLFNVLSGAMSIVGPRPERPEIAEQYEEIYPNFAFRTKVKAGLTGFAQIYGRYNTAPEEKLFLDIMYIETFSILEDLRLILQTVKVVFNFSSTEGIDTGNTTALRK
ncbi:MAG: exopolysaccharide biosynthesis polyprenyl glycosylphosphotransferase [Oscillospiraceae bacterium]|nr:exopolysaccharide biosynthesis polyprenyl glycosylphosphotransferase [Oscillospiraceae bacterium]